MKTPTELEQWLRANYQYDPVTGNLIGVTNLNRHKAGRVVGSLRKDGYLGFRTLGSQHLVHRVCYFLQTGTWPPAVDHANGVRTDNRWSNLRGANNTQNIQNSKVWGGKTLPKGVSRNGSRYRSRIRVRGNVLFLGNFATPELAHEAYQKAADVHFKEFANYGDYRNTNAAPRTQSPT